MALTKEKKEEIIQELKDKKKKQKAMVFVDFSGLGVKDLTNLRNKMKETGCELRVAKKTLIKLVFEDIGPEFAEKIKGLQGEIAVGFGYKDEIQPFKVLGDFSNTNKNIKVLGGVIGKEFLEVEQAIMLSKLPTKQELLARVVGSISAPLSGFVNVLQGNMRGLVYILSTIKGR